MRELNRLLVGVALANFFLLHVCVEASAEDGLSKNDVVVVQWGEPGGAKDIVIEQQGMDPLPTASFESGVSREPGSDYYPNLSTGRTPKFNAAAATGDGSQLSDRNIQNNEPNGDRINLASTKSGKVSGMVVWESANWLKANNTLRTLRLEGFRYNPPAGKTTGATRFLMQKNNGEWFASQPNSLSPGFTSIGGDAATMKWFAFKPFDDGEVEIAESPSDVNVKGVKSVGYFFSVEQAGGEEKNGAMVRFFQATAAGQ